MICKCICIVITFNKENSFILTMWYVNEFEETYISKAESSFILTMWYVNSEVFLSFSLSSSGFILTMWYVNFYNS